MKLPTIGTKGYCMHDIKNASRNILDLHKRYTFLLDFYIYL